MARNPLPDNVKHIRGTFRKDRSNPNQPKVEPRIPSPHPKLLSTEERFHYWRLARILSRMKVLAESDVVTLELGAIFLAAFYKAKEDLKDGKTYEVQTREGSIVIKKKPQISMMNEAFQNAMVLLSRFGLTPADRTRLKVLPDPKPKNKWGGS